jgi:hypothetical protein
LRVAASAWQRASSCQQPAEAANFLMAAIKDIAVVAADNAQKIAQLQAQAVFEAAGAKGAYSFVKLDPKNDIIDIDQTDHSIVQQCHVEAMQELRKFSKEITPSKHADNKPRRSGGGFNNYNRYRGRGGGGNGYRSGGGWRGGRGRGSSNMGGRGGWRSNSNGGSSPNDNATDN